MGVAFLVVEGTLASPLARAANPYLSPNHLGLFLGRTGAVALALALFGLGIERTRRDLERRTAWAGFAVIAIGVLRTVSLGAWAGLAAAGIGLIALKGRRWVLAGLVGVSIVLLAGVVLLPASRTTARFDPSTGTGLFRLQIWTSSVRMVADHPILGIGLDNFLYQYRGGYMLPEAAEEPNISHPHNWLLNFWLELGLLGVAAAVALLVWAGRSVYQLVCSPARADDRLLGAAALGVFVDTLVHGSLDNSYFLVDAAVIWWVFIALLAIQRQPLRAGEMADDRRAVEFSS